jgi:ribose transport system substrate-binding protein
MRRAGCILALIAAVSVTADAGVSSATAQAQAKKPRVAVLLFSRGFEFMRGLDDGIRREAAKLGADVTVLEGQSRADVQERQIEERLAAGIDAIIISPSHSREIVRAIRKANEAKVPVVAVDAHVAEGARVATFVGFDNAAGGKVAAEYLIGLGTVTKVLDLQGSRGHHHADKRGSGFAAAAKGHLKIVPGGAEWLAENAKTVVIQEFSAHRDLDGIFSHNDEMVRGVLVGLRQINRAAGVGQAGHIPIVGIDGTPLALARIRNGEQDATVNQDPFEMGAIALRSALAAIRGASLPAEQLLPPTLVTKENVDDPTLWGNRFKP